MDYWLAVASGDRVGRGEERIITDAEIREKFALDSMVASGRHACAPVSVGACDYPTRQVVNCDETVID